MKKFTWFIYGLVIIFLFGCTLPTGGAPPGDGSPSIPLPSPSATKPAPPASRTPTPVTPESGALQGGNVPTGFDIPSRNDPAPAGILEQLSWSDVGGGSEGPQVCGNCDVVMGVDRILVSNFQPSQELKVLIYRHNECKQKTAEYVTTLSIQVDKAGNFSAGLSGPTRGLIVVSVLDGKTGERIWKRPFEDYRKLNCPDSQGLNSCPGAPSQRLKVEEMAYVCTANDSVKLREGPGKSFSIIKSLVPGADVTIIGGPTCADNWSWWKVKTESGYTGWMSEGGDKTDPYFLCPKP